MERIAGLSDGPLVCINNGHDGYRHRRVIVWRWLNRRADAVELIGVDVATFGEAVAAGVDFVVVDLIAGVVDVVVAAEIGEVVAALAGASNEVVVDEILVPDG